MNGLMIDCNACTARGPACEDCVVSTLLGVPDATGTALADEEVRALDALNAGGLLPPLRLVRPLASFEPELDGGRNGWQPGVDRLDFG